MIKKLNICLIYPGFPPEDDIGGGISIYCNMLVDSLVSLGIYPTVITRSNNLVPKINSYKGAKIYRVPAGNFNSLTLKLVVDFSNELTDLVNKLEASHGKFDVIEMVDWGGEAISFLPEYKDRLIIRCHTPGFIAQSFNPSNEPYLNNEILELEQNVLLNAKYIVTSSKLLMAKIEDFLNQKLKYTLSPIMGIGDQTYAKKKYKKYFNSKVPMRVICCGRIEERKGFGLLVNVVDELIDIGYNIRLDIYGNSTPLIRNEKSSDKLQKIIKHKDNIKILGEIKHNLLLKMYKKYDLCVVPSHFESWSLVGIEAISSGLPTLLSKGVELAHRLSYSKNKLIFEINKNDDLKAKSQYIYDNYLDIRKVFVRDYNQIVRILSPNKVAYEILKYYQSIK